MADKLPMKTDKRIDQLTPKERAEFSVFCARQYTRGVNYSEMSRQTGLTTGAVKKLIQEHAAYIKEARPDTKSLQEETYRQLYGELADIDPTDGTVPALVRSTAIQGRIQLLTRLDKILGHEAPTTSISVEGKTLLDVAQQFYGPGGQGEGVSPMDTAAVYEGEIVDAEVVNDNDED
jgi:hypothetical protein